MRDRDKAIAFKQQQESMVSCQLRGRDITDERVLAVMAELPRELFLDEPLRSQAYTDGPLPIGQGQTISQPYIQALMTQHLHLEGTEKVLEIGTGSGYQTAILARLSREVFTVERIAELSMSARRILDSLGLDNVHYIVADGSEGMEEAAPFEAILVTAACPEVPEPLVEQLGENGRLVAPVGPRDTQDLVLVTREGEQIRRKSICPCRFVPLLGKHAFQ
ncbi:MAG: protein-L-isoaspartate(D-aspartate) O-methyltransferase [Actinobacteria bacterium]|nr:protein-L-isoaspartate(D-aspartate) O-methyltransferase [Actinomycetota bacterium]